MPQDDISSHYFIKAEDDERETLRAAYPLICQHPDLILIGSPMDFKSKPAYVVIGTLAQAKKLAATLAQSDLPVRVCKSEVVYTPIEAN